MQLVAREATAAQVLEVSYFFVFCRKTQNAKCSSVRLWLMLPFASLQVSGGAHPRRVLKSMATAGTQSSTSKANRPKPPAAGESGNDRHLVNEN